MPVFIVIVVMLLWGAIIVFLSSTSILPEQKTVKKKVWSKQEFDELVEKLLRCPTMFKGLVFTEVKHVQPFLKEEIEKVLKQHIDVKEK